jgi:radical SAM superfamily enzyme YgiQ (UPF0313 family)
MRVLLVYTNRDWSIVAPPPIGLAYVAKPLRDRGNEVKLLDLMHVRNPHDDLQQTISACRPDLVGFSIRNLDNQDMLNLTCPLPEIRELVRIAKGRGLMTVLGGTAVTTLPEEVLRYMEADYAVAGQGETSFMRLVQSAEAGAVDRETPGLVWSENGKTFRNPCSPFGYAEAEADWSILDFRPYRRSILPASVIVKSGCPYSCIYCDSGTTMGKEFVVRKPDAVVGDMEAIVRLHGIRAMFLTDPCFNAPLDYSKSVLEAIIKANLGLSLSAMLVPVPGQYDEEFLRLFRRAGGRFLILGAESFSAKMLENYRKPFQIEDALAAAALVIRHGIHLGIVAMFGGPGENQSTIRESIAAIQPINYSLFEYGIGVRITPGCGLLDLATSEGLIKDRSDLLFPKFYVSRDLNVPWAAQYIRSRMQRYWYRNLKMGWLGARIILSNYLHTSLPARRKAV